MQKSIMIVLLFTLTTVFSGCTNKDVLHLESELKSEIGQLLNIHDINTTNTCTEIPTYEIPSKKYCDNDMTLKECFLFQYSVARELRYVANKQLKAVVIINEGNK